ncbi:MAG: DUF6338 family protein [Chloroflexota bacterium]|nr:DUF6338 family protein [Chloroflexota bacterium]
MAKLTVLVVPVVGGFILSTVYDTLLFPLARQPSAELRWYHRLVAPKPPTGWDTFFLQNVPNGSFLLLEFDDNAYIGGTWETGSFASTSPASPALYLPREWKVNVDLSFGGYVANTSGVYIGDPSEIRGIRVLF